jgi:pimeloyl-ACP methyl ester carboxylesterase
MRRYDPDKGPKSCSELSVASDIRGRFDVIAFDKIGNGKPVVFLHSGLADRQMWQPQIPAIAERYTCYALDLPGYGASSSPTEPFSYPEEIAKFIEQTIGAPAAMIGSSFGASQVFLTALVAPAWTGPLILANTGVMRPEEASDALKAVWTEADAAWDRGERDRANEIEIEGWVDGKGRRDSQAPALMRDYFQRANRAIWERHSAEPLPDELPSPAIEPARIQQPVLLIDSPYDFPDILQSNVALLAALSHAEYVSIPDAAHFPSYEQPGEFNRVVLEFLDRTWGSGGA